MQSAADYKSNQQFSVLIQGPPKAGKTTLALQFPRPYVADLDNNLEGTFRWLKRSKMPFEHIKFDIPDIMEKDGVIVERPLKDRYVFMCKSLAEAAASPEIDTIIVDGMTKLNAYIIGEICRQMPTVEKGSRQRRDGEMTLQDWGYHLWMWQQFITKLQATSKMFVLTAHEEFSDIPEMPNVTLVAMQGKKAQQVVPGMFTDVWRCEVEEKKTATATEYIRTVRTMATGRYQLGNSLGLKTMSSYKDVLDALQSEFKLGGVAK